MPGNIVSTLNHDKRRNKRSAYRFQRYTTPACKQCKSRTLCTKSITNVRYIDRNEYAEVIEASNNRVNYHQRQQITEHHFDTLKRQWGFAPALLRKKKRIGGGWSDVYWVQPKRLHLNTWRN